MFIHDTGIYIVHAYLQTHTHAHTLMCIHEQQKGKRQNWEIVRKRHFNSYTFKNNRAITYTYMQPSFYVGNYIYTVLYCAGSCPNINLFGLHIQAFVKLLPYLEHTYLYITCQWCSVVLSGCKMHIFNQ